MHSESQGYCNHQEVTIQPGFYPQWNSCCLHGRGIPPENYYCPTTASLQLLHHIYVTELDEPHHELEHSQDLHRLDFNLVNIASTAKK